jgi:CheY-like chemotaxis protein
MITTLIVEDNGEFRLFLKNLLLGRFPGAVVAEAGDGHSALELLARVKPDVVVVDIGLPGGMNGLTLTERIRKDGRRPSIVILTDHALPEYKAAAMLAGADHFLPKASSTAAEILSVFEGLTQGGRAVAPN